MRLSLVHLRQQNLFAFMVFCHTFVALQSFLYHDKAIFTASEEIKSSTSNKLEKKKRMTTKMTREKVAKVKMIVADARATCEDCIRSVSLARASLQYLTDIRHIVWTRYINRSTFYARCCVICLWMCHFHLDYFVCWRYCENLLWFFCRFQFVFSVLLLLLMRLLLSKCVATIRIAKSERSKSHQTNEFRFRFCWKFHFFFFLCCCRTFFGPFVLLSFSFNLIVRLFVLSFFTSTMITTIAHLTLEKHNEIIDRKSE